MAKSALVLGGGGVLGMSWEVGEKMTGAPVTESMRVAIEERARNEQPVVLRVTPVSAFGR